MSKKQHATTRTAETASISILTPTPKQLAKIRSLNPKQLQRLRKALQGNVGFLSIAEAALRQCEVFEADADKYLALATALKYTLATTLKYKLDSGRSGRAVIPHRATKPRAVLPERTSKRKGGQQ